MIIRYGNRFNTVSYQLSLFAPADDTDPIWLPVCNKNVLSSVGAGQPSQKDVAMTDLERAHPELLPGGRGVPSGCVARQRVAVVVPFRDRESHLRIFLNVLHPFLQRQQLDYTIFIVEQVRQLLGCGVTMCDSDLPNSCVTFTNYFVIFKNIFLKVLN